MEIEQSSRGAVCLGREHSQGCIMGSSWGTIIDHWTLVIGLLALSPQAAIASGLDLSKSWMGAFHCPKLGNMIIPRCQGVRKEKAYPLSLPWLEFSSAFYLF